jgi:nuclear receptor interaction protein
MEAGNGVNYTFVNRAFGGLRTTVDEDSDSDLGQERSQDDIETNVEEEPIRDINLVRTDSTTRRSTRRSHHQADALSTDGDADANANDDGEAETSSDNDNEEEQGEEEDDDDGEDLGGWDMSSDEDEDEDDDSDAEENFARRYGIRKTRREDVELEVPCSPHTRVYRGHCNIKTVKDVNFFGMNDEYVVSGSDSGHVFIWDRKTANLVNILEGDSEVVNVVQGKFASPCYVRLGC